MNLRPHRSMEPDLNLTPLIDVVFLLLIFFMVSTTFEREAALRVDLPDASAETQAEPPASLEIIINAQGGYFVNGERVVNDRVATLRAAIRQAMNGDNSQSVVISADAQTPHQAVITAMDIVGQLGFSNLSFATQQVQQ